VVATQANRFIAFVLAGLFLAAGCRTPRDMPPAELTQDLDREIASSGSVEQAVISRTNAERKVAGLRPLISSPQLDDAARRHAANMARRNTMDHNLEGRSPADRVKAVGFDYRAVGENIAQKQLTPTAAVDAWMKSPGHRRNLLGEVYTHIGVGMAVNANGEPYWVQVFGTPR
jgi:uncharacterized protein YkwD